MAKIRVYELAKDLNMTNRALLNKMKELKIEVKSHMSSLENGAVSAIKRGLFGKAKRNKDVKVKPSVIRRRRKDSEEIIAPEIEEESITPVEEKIEKIVVRKKNEPVAEKDAKVVLPDIEQEETKDIPKDQDIEKVSKKNRTRAQKKEIES